MHSKLGLSLSVPDLYMLIVIKHFTRSSGAMILFRSLCVPHAIRAVHYEFYVQTFLGNFSLIIFHFFRGVRVLLFNYGKLKRFRPADIAYSVLLKCNDE